MPKRQNKTQPKGGPAEPLRSSGAKNSAPVVAVPAISRKRNHFPSAKLPNQIAQTQVASQKLTENKIPKLPKPKIPNQNQSTTPINPSNGSTSNAQIDARPSASGSKSIKRKLTSDESDKKVKLQEDKTTPKSEEKEGDVKKKEAGKGCTCKECLYNSVEAIRARLYADPKPKKIVYPDIATEIKNESWESKMRRYHNSFAKNLNTVYFKQLQRDQNAFK